MRQMFRAYAKAKDLFNRFFNDIEIDFYMEVKQVEEVLAAA